MRIAASETCKSLCVYTKCDDDLLQSIRAVRSTHTHTQTRSPVQSLNRIELMYVRRSVRRNATTRRVDEEQFAFGNGQATVQNVWSSMDLRYVCNGNAKQFEGETTTNETNENRVHRRFYLAFEHLCQLRKENKQRKQCKRRRISHRLVVAISLPHEHHHLHRHSQRTR